jgi:glycosyltransferase involved in cell wall biosynthesis
VRSALRERRYDLVIEDINKLPLYLPLVTRLPLYVIIPHLFGTTVFQEASWPVAMIVWSSERPIPFVYREATFHAISDSTREDLIERGIASEAVRVIYPGVDSEWYAPLEQAGRDPEPGFLYVGRLKRYKGLETALRAVAVARSRGHAVRLDLAGTGDDRARLERLAAALGVGDAVRFLGYVSEEQKRDLMRRAWAVVFPSAKEGWGLSNVEAAACGTPAVAADRPGLRESVRHEETGLLVPYGDPEALADALIRLALNRDLVERFGRAARRFAETFSWDRTADETEAHLLETLNRG